MKKLVFIALLSLIGMTNVFAQQETTATAEKVFDVVDDMPSFTGGTGGNDGVLVEEHQIRDRRIT